MDAGRARRVRRPPGRVVRALVLFTTVRAPALSAVFHTRDEIPSLAFADADRVASQRFFLRAEQHARIEKLARAPLDSDLLTVYRGIRAGSTIGYAIVDSHLVRTLPEALLIVLSPEGAVTATHVLAFYEPSEYLPVAGWFEQFLGIHGRAPLRIGRDVAGITGSTLSSRAVAAALRRALAIYEVLLSGDP